MTIRKRMKLFSTIDRNLILYREPNNVLEDSLRKSNGGVKITTQISALKNLPSFVTFQMYPMSSLFHSKFTCLLPTVLLVICCNASIASLTAIAVDR